jgi:cell division septum initiation protein DivIVA
MSDVFERLNSELEQVGQRLRSAIEISRLQAEKAGLVALRGRAAYQLGLVVHARERGDTPDAGEYERLVARMDDLTHQISELERRVSEEEGHPDTVHTKPAPPADEAEAEVGSAK